jgi:hypothetical protein
MKFIIVTSDSDIHVNTLMWPCLRPRYGIFTVGTSGITNQSAVFDPHPDVGPVYKKTKHLLMRGDTLTRDQGNNKCDDLINTRLIDNDSD